jgi:SAM-dependent methyltransferase
MNQLGWKLLRDPLGTMVRGIQKTLIAPRRYGRDRGYDARMYWQDRFSRHGESLRGPGDEGLSEAENRRMYAEAGRVFLDVCATEGVDLKAARVLEVGCGTGFYTALLHNAGVMSYVGVDITDVCFPSLQERFQGYKFAMRDITTNGVEGTFDLVVMIDVIEHIVEVEELAAAMRHVRRALAHDGVLILGPVYAASERHLFYVRFWSLDDMLRCLPGLQVSAAREFRTGTMLALRETLPADAS